MSYYIYGVMSYYIYAYIYIIGVVRMYYQCKQQLTQLVATSLFIPGSNANSYAHTNLYIKKRTVMLCFASQSSGNISLINYFR